MKFRNFAGAAGALAAASAATLPALATEGYFSNGIGAVNKSMAGAGVAAGFDAMSQATNPATLVLVETQLVVDFSVLNTDASHDVSAGAGGPPFDLADGRVDADGDVFYAPAIGNVWEIDDSSSWGWALYSNGAMNTAWSQPAAGVFGDGPAGLDLEQTFLQITYAQEISPEVYLGFSPIIAVQRFQAEGLGALAASSINAANLSGNGYDLSYGYGGKIGLQADIGGGFSFGAAYQSEMFMTKLDRYSGLLANAGGLNIPAALQTGLAWRSKSGFVAALDYKRIFYGDVDALSNPIAKLGAGALFGSPGGPGFGWEDIDIVKLGIEVPVGSSLKLRAGAAMNTSPVSESEVLLNILMPAVQEEHYTAGLSLKLGDNHTVNLGGMYSPSSSVLGPNAGETIELEGSQWEATLGWTWTY